MPKQRRLTDKERAEVITDCASGKSQSEIAEKFSISKTAVSKILRNYKSLQNNDKFTDKPKSKPLVKLNKTQKEMSDEIVQKATVALLLKDYDALPAETLVKIIERMTFIYRDVETKEPITAIEVKVIDGSGNDTVN